MDCRCAANLDRTDRYRFRERNGRSRNHNLFLSIVLTKCNNGNILVIAISCDPGKNHILPGNVLIGAAYIPGFGKRTFKMTPAGDVELPPYNFSHRLLRCHPRATGMTPSRRTGHSDLHPKRISQGKGVSECVLPFRSHIDQASIYNRWRGEGCIKMMEPGNPRPVHPLQILPDAVFCYVSVHPVPPDKGAGFVGRIRKRGFQTVQVCLTVLCAREHKNEGKQERD